MSSCVACDERPGFDPGFKLFGKTILDFKDEKQQQQPENPIVLQSSSCDQTKQDPIVVQSSSCEQTKEKGGEEEVGSSESEKTVLKKPDKLLPCPRCESMDTKFCYYNNYNVNQPRHFCKNCQRYWTAGGSLRNVPVGAGRRKNKQSSCSSSSMASSRQFRSALDDYDNPISSARPLKIGRPSIQIDGSNPGGAATILNFGPDGKTLESGRDEISCGSSVTAEREAQAAVHMRPNGAVVGCPPPPVPFFTGPWPYGWSPNPGPWGALPWPMVPGTPWATGPWVPSPWAPIGPHAVPPPATVSTNINQAQGNRENGGLHVPKTLRIDDPGEATQSSIWASLARGSTECNASAFKAFKPFKPKKEVHSVAASQALLANPAAFSRSLSFQESN